MNWIFKIMKKGKKTTKKKSSKRINRQTTQPYQESVLLKGAGKNNIVALSWRYLFDLHQQMVSEAVRRLLNTPMASIMSCIMIALALVLPALFFLFVTNIQQLGENWGGKPSISLYLKKDITQNQLDRLSASTLDYSAIIDKTYISPKEGLNTLQKTTGITRLTSELGYNPLPGVLRLKIKQDTSSDELNSLANTLKKIPTVDQVHLDKQWVERLMAIASLLKHASAVLAILLSVTVWLAISNTIDLSIEARKNELKVLSLVGSTDSYIMLPFLYTGIIYGIAGACFAVLILWTILMAMMPSIMALVGLYESSFYVTGPSLALCLLLILSGAFLGGVGAWMSCYKHLKHYMPR